MSKVGEWIQHPERLNEDSVGVLRRLVDKYPYYQTARLLLLRNLFNTKNPMFQQELRRSAVLLNNRKVLFDMIEGTKYHIVPQQLSSNSLSWEGDKDRTLSLIDDFLENMPSEPEKRPTKGNIPADVTTDYMAYLMQEEAEANDSNNIIETTIPRRPQRITLEEKDVIEVPEDDVQEEEFFTETLAQIYIKQQKFERALEIIRALSADNPKKNSYFADQIRYLEKVIELKKAEKLNNKI
jgi:tetratricopeptide (TPR) repeat protein